VNDARIGTTIAGRYTIEAVIGEGGMGVVYRAEHRLMHKRVAVKVLRPSADAEIIERFHREAIAGAHVDHPNVATAIDFGELEDGAHFLVQEYLEGQDLRTALQGGPVEVARALRIARQIAAGARAAHQLGIVHRDLKPENVMLVRRDGFEVAKILDFGVARVPVQELAKRRPAGAVTRAGVAYGTPAYMPPEQSLGEEVDGRADLYAIGVILYEMLSGTRPFDDADRARLRARVATEAPPSLSARVPYPLPRGLEALVAALLEKSPLRRTPNADALLYAIDALAAIDVTIEPSTFSATGNAGSAPLSNVSPAPPVVSTSHEASKADTIVARGPQARPEVRPNLPLLFASGLASIVVLVALAAFARSPATLDELEAEDLDAGETSTVASASSASPHASASAMATPVVAPLAELDAARAGGLVALGPLAQRYPEDPGVLKALLLAHAAEPSGLASAMATARRLLLIAPERAQDPDVRRTIIAAAAGPQEAAQIAFELMTTAMGERGPDLLFEMALAANTPKTVRERALQALASPESRLVTSESLAIANELRTTLPCGRKTLLPRARDRGDARSLQYLKPLLPTTGCGLIRRSDCYSCFGNRAELHEAIDAIERRASGR
jgi:serine/threonine-protein kinase